MLQVPSNGAEEGFPLRSGAVRTRVFGHVLNGLYFASYDLIALTFVRYKVLLVVWRSDFQKMTVELRELESILKVTKKQDGRRAWEQSI